MIKKFKIFLLIFLPGFFLIFSNEIFSRHFNFMSLQPAHTFTLHPCSDLTATCFSNKGNHLVGYLSIPRVARMVQEKIVCLPYGQPFNESFVEKVIQRCNKTYPFSCKKDGCSPHFDLR